MGVQRRGGGSRHCSIQGSGGPAVGHENRCDALGLCRDHRAPTPSAAAEAVVPVLAEIMERLDELARRLRRLVDTMLQMQRHRFERSLSVLGETRFRIQAQAQRLDELQGWINEGLDRTADGAAARTGGAPTPLVGTGTAQSD